MHMLRFYSRNIFIEFVKSSWLLEWYLKNKTSLCELLSTNFPRNFYKWFIRSIGWHFGMNENRECREFSVESGKWSSTAMAHTWTWCNYNSNGSTLLFINLWINAFSIWRNDSSVSKGMTTAGIVFYETTFDIIAKWCGASTKYACEWIAKTFDTNFSHISRSQYSLPFVRRFHSYEKLQTYFPLSMQNNSRTKDTKINHVRKD